MNAKTLMTTALAGLFATAAHAITSDEIAAALDVDPSIGTFSTGGYSEWYADSENAENGMTCLRSGALPGNSSNWLWSDLDLSFAVKKSSRLTFKIKTHSRNNGSYDSYLGVKVDNGTASVYAGDLDWREVSFVLVPGQHVVHLGFGKRYYNDSNSDYCAWVDDLKLTPILPTPTAVEVTDIKCTQRYPWNGMVDIDYTVKCEKADADVWVYPVGYDKDSNTTMAPRSLTGDGVNAPVKAGTHRMTWKVTDDYPDFNSTAFTVKMTALVGAAPYMVVDLSGGVDALSYPVSYLSSVPEGGWGDEYKTTKLVLRLIPPGSFMMGSPSDELGRSSNEDRHGVVLTKPFYVGVFECTQKQYELIMGSNPSEWKNNTHPVERVSYVNIRGSVNGIGWPTHNQVDANSFMGRLRSKTNMLFDLPTEAQWEYACRAGTGSSLHSGKEITSRDSCPNAADVARYAYNGGWSSGGNHAVVGGYMANAWGLYDMHGNIYETCRDLYVSNLGSASTIDPIGGTTGTSITLKGGTFASGASGIRSAVRVSLARDNVYRDYGFRVYCSPVAQ